MAAPPSDTHRHGQHVRQPQWTVVRCVATHLTSESTGVIGNLWLNEQPEAQGRFRPVEPALSSRASQNTWQARW